MSISVLRKMISKNSGSNISLIGGSTSMDRNKSGGRTDKLVDAGNVAWESGGSDAFNIL